MTTDGTLLGGRVAYRQPATGFRSGIEPVLLAASVPAHAGQHIIEAGTGAGAALLCLTARVPGICATGVEIDKSLADLAIFNASSNGFSRMEVQTGALGTTILPGNVDHAIANPPYHAPSGSPSPSPARETAKRATATLLDTWIGHLAATLRPRGTLTFILPAAMIPACLTAMADRHCPCSVIFPLWSKSDRPAKLALLRGIKHSKSPVRLLPGLVLHQPNGAFTSAAQAILANAEPLRLSD